MDYFHWSFDSDGDDDDSDPHEFLLKRSKPQKIAADMKIKPISSRRKPKVQLNDEEELAEDLHALGIHYRDEKSSSKDLEKMKTQVEEENRMKCIEQGRVPVLLGKEFFQITPKEPKRRKKKRRHSKKSESIPDFISICSTTFVDTNPFRNPFEFHGPKEAEDKQKSAVMINTSSKKEDHKPPKNLILPKKRRITVAQQIVDSLKLQNGKKKTFKKFEEVNFNPEDLRGPSVGVAGLHHYTARQYCLNPFR